MRWPCPTAARRSRPMKPKLAARCNVVGHLENAHDLAKIRSGEKITVSRA